MSKLNEITSIKQNEWWITQSRQGKGYFLYNTYNRLQIFSFKEILIDWFDPLECFIGINDHAAQNRKLGPRYNIQYPCD